MALQAESCYRQPAASENYMRLISAIAHYHPAVQAELIAFMLLPSCARVSSDSALRREHFF
jgi:hypothetical protein